MSYIASAVFALVVVGVAFPSKAEATCAHYSLSRSEREVFSRLSDLELLSVGASSREMAPEEAPSRKPCSGPTCSRGPSEPNAPVPKAPGNGERWLCASVIIEVTSPDSCWFRDQEPSPRAVNCSSRLERPPRPHFA